jgi:hypothetical protein
MESDTPRTDANELVARDTPALGLVVFVDEDERVVDAKFARELERELASMREERDEAYTNLCIACEEIATRAMYASRTGSPCTGKQIAAERGWDCFGQKEGGGA